MQPTQWTEPERAGRSGSWWPDALIVLLILAAWAPAAWWITGGKRVVWYDTFRDMAWAENMRAGRVWADPVVPGQSWWYAPGGPLLAAGLARLSGWSVADVYGTSALWWNAWIPVAVYVLARSAWGRGTALVALATVFLGSYWWYTHVAAPIPGIQAVTLSLLVLLCWHVSATSRRGDAWAVVGGVILAACTWHHPVCGIVAALTILLHTLYDALRRPHSPRRSASAPAAGRSAGARMAIVAVVAAVLTSPLIMHMLAIHARNPELLKFTAPEIAHPAFYAHAHTPLIVPAALLGVWVVLRYAPGTFWVVGYFLATLLLQVPAYIAHSLRLELPYLLPHEMQWHMQLAEGLCAAVAIMWIAREASRAAGRLSLLAPIAVLLGAVAVGPALWQSLRQEEYFIDLDRLAERTREVRAWIESHTSLEDTIACNPELGHAVIAGLTGRKCIAVSRGHMYPAPDVGRRYGDADERLSADNPSAAAAVARRYKARYLLYMFESSERAAAASESLDAFPALERCFTSSDGKTFVYGVRAEAPR
jgi:hypothetical protein